MYVIILHNIYLVVNSIFKYELNVSINFYLYNFIQYLLFDKTVRQL